MTTEEAIVYITETIAGANIAGATDIVVPLRIALGALQAQLARENPQPLAKADRIRTMDDDRLAYFLDGIRDIHDTEGGGDYKLIGGEMIPNYDGSIREWLRKPVDDKDVGEPT